MGSPRSPQAKKGSAQDTINKCKGDVCKCLRDKIDELVNNVRSSPGSGTQGLATRFAAQVAGGAEPPNTAAWSNHQDQIINQQNQVNDHLNAYDKNKCPDDDLPPNARAYASRPLPTAAEWQANNPGVPIPSASSMSSSLLNATGWTLVGLVGLKVVGAAVGSLVGPAGTVAGAMAMP